MTLLTANSGRLTDTTRSVPAQTVLADDSLPAVNITRRYDYDHAGRLLQERHLDINGVERTLGTEYWPNGAVKKKYLADGSSTGDYIYDNAGALSRIANLSNGSSPANYITSIIYNPRGQAIDINSGNSTHSFFTYDDKRGWLTRLRTLQGAAEIIDLNCVRNLNGQHKSVTSLTGDTAFYGPRNWVYTYHELNRLTAANWTAGGAEDRVFAYGDAENMLRNSGLCVGATNFTYPAQGPTAVRPHAPSATCGSTVDYDAAGNALKYDPNGSGSAALPRTLIGACPRA